MEEEAMTGDVCQGQDGSGLTSRLWQPGRASALCGAGAGRDRKSVAADCGLEIVNADNALDPQIAVDNTRLFMTQEVDGIIHFNVHGDIARVDL